MGATRVNDEFEVGFAERFEAGWYRAEIVGRFVMATLVAVAASGLLGRGPISHARAATPDGHLAVDYEPVARHGTPTMVTLHVRNAAPTATPVRVHLDNHMIEPMGLQRTVPPANASDSVDDGAELAFTIAPGQRDALIRFELRPSALGPVSLSMDDGGAAVRWTMFVVP